MHTNFGEFLVQRRLKSDISAKWLAEALGISQVYMCDIEKGRRRMSDELLKRLSELLLLSEEERYEMYDLAAKSYNTVSLDVTEYVMSNDMVRRALRTAQKYDTPDDVWQEFIAQIIVHGK